MSRSALFILSLLLIAACDSESKPRKVAPAPHLEAPAAETAPADEDTRAEPPTPPALPTRSSFTHKLTPRTQFPAAEPPGEEPLLPRWDFGGTAPITYAFTEETLMGVEPEAPPVSRNRLEGVYRLTPKTGKATLALEVEKNVATSLEKPGEPGVESPPQTLEVEGFGPDGRLGKDAESRSPLASFALPNAPLTLGQPLEEPDAHPFNLAGTRFEVGGTLTYTLEGYVVIEGTTCAWIHIEGDYSALEIPEEVGDDARIHTRVESSLCFDPEKKRLVFAETASRQAFWMWLGKETLYIDADTWMSLRLEVEG